MNRREAIKSAGLIAAVAVIGTQAQAEVKVALNRIEMKPQDATKPTDFELKHLPQITLKEKDASGYTLVEITVGQNSIIHPSTPDHWIDFIELYTGDKLVGRNTLQATISRGATSFAVKLDGVKMLTAKAGCNLHGIWTSTLAL